MDDDNYIKSNLKFIDIQSEHARNCLDYMVDLLCSSIVPDERPLLNELGDISLQECHEYVSKFLYDNDNIIVVNEVLQNRSLISNEEYIDGYASTNNLQCEHLIELSSKRFFESVAALEHELIHIIPVINNNNPDEQYQEILSIFGEFLTLRLLSEKYNNDDIYLNNDIYCTAGGIPSDIPFRTEFIKKHQYSEYEKIINLCDLMCTKVVNTVDKGLIDIMIRRGVYENTQYHIKETYKLKEYFDGLLGYSLYDLFPEIKENL